VVEVIEESFNAGGAANVARNLREFIEHVHMLGIIGTGHDAAILRELLEARGILLDAVQTDAGYQTIRKTRIIARTQQVVRVDRERRTSLTDAQRDIAFANFRQLLPNLDAVIMEDYDKGLHDQALADAFIEATKTTGTIVCVDPKPTNPVDWHDITAVTPNRLEAFQCAGRPWREPVDPPESDRALREVGTILLEKWRCQCVLVTLSEQGMMLFESGRDPFHIPTRAQEVYDVSGAGDTAIALFTASLAGGATPAEAAEIANHGSGIVVGKLGTAIVERAELLASFE
jgi:D-beta-D-heptose 7-phosphate kinase/D-beta-D-heptose 1-phosphate adenosyltransferase